MKKENIMKSLNDEILALSTLFEAGRISKKDFESLKKDAEEADAKRVEALKTESAPKKLDYSADSDLPLTRIPLPPQVITNEVRKYVNTRGNPKLRYRNHPYVAPRPRGIMDTFIHTISGLTLWAFFLVVVSIPILVIGDLLIR
jgi:hypothetical protein